VIRVGIGLRLAPSYLSRLGSALFHTFATKNKIVSYGMGEYAQMSDDIRQEIPFVRDDELREQTPLAPQVASLPDADRRLLEALLRELLRDNSLRELLCKEEV
jgi:hypothetical protein